MPSLVEQIHWFGVTLEEIKAERGGSAQAAQH